MPAITKTQLENASRDALDLGKFINDPIGDVTARLGAVYPNLAKVISQITAQFTAVVRTTESLIDGDFVNIYDLAGNPRVRQADASDELRYANGYVLNTYSNGVDATVWLFGVNSHITLTTSGTAFLSEMAGGWSFIAPSSSNTIVQELGLALEGKGILFTPQQRIIL